MKNRLRDLRKARGWTLEQAAGQAGLARSTLSKIENGQMSPTFDALKKLAEGLGISVPQLFTPPSRGQVTGRMVVTKSGEGATQITTTVPADTTQRMRIYAVRPRGSQPASFAFTMTAADKEGGIDRSETTFTTAQGQGHAED